MPPGMESLDFCVSNLPEGFDANGIADAVAEFTGDAVLVSSVHRTHLELRLPQQCATHVVKMLVEMHVNLNTPCDRHQVIVTRV